MTSSRAVFLIQSAFKINEKSPEYHYHYHLGQVYLQDEKPALAKEQFELAISLGDFAARQEVEALLNQL